MVPHCLWATNHRSDCPSHLLAENFVLHTHFSHNSNSQMTREKLTPPLTPRQQSGKHTYKICYGDLHCSSYRHKIKLNEEKATRLQPGRGEEWIQQILGEPCPCTQRSHKAWGVWMCPYYRACPCSSAKMSLQNSLFINPESFRVKQGTGYGKSMEIHTFTKQGTGAIQFYFLNYFYVNQKNNGGPG